MDFYAGFAISRSTSILLFYLLLLLLLPGLFKTLPRFFRDSFAVLVLLVDLYGFLLFRFLQLFLLFLPFSLLWLLDPLLSTILVIEFSSRRSCYSSLCIYCSAPYVISLSSLSMYLLSLSPLSSSKSCSHLSSFPYSYFCAPQLPLQ